mmetsp:Transcript_69258/g.166080  ORF Transcript_69258/g.166080 Transcript_69258/m.166080 type:complete len:176 (+) Transcript_69258:68-595(+)
MAAARRQAASSGMRRQFTRGLAAILLTATFAWSLSLRGGVFVTSAPRSKALRNSLVVEDSAAAVAPSQHNGSSLLAKSASHLRTEAPRWQVLLPAIIVGFMLRMSPCFAQIESPAEALAPWLAVVPYYGPVLYLIALGVQQFSYENFNVAYLVCALLFLGPGLFLFVQWQYFGVG